ncbi:TolC family protein [Gemmatimonadota bacterium]
MAMQPLTPFGHRWRQTRQAPLQDSGPMRRIVVALFPVLLLSALPFPSGAQEAFTLDDLLRLGRERSPTLQSAEAEYAAQEADRLDTGRWQNPELEYELGRGDPFESGDSRSLWGFGLSQSFENPLTRHFRMGAVRFRVEAARNEVSLAVLEVEHEIRVHYYRVLFLSELLRLARLNEEALEAIRGLIDTRAALGEVRELEAIRLRVEHLRARNQVEAAEMELDQYRVHLNTYLGNALPDDFRLAGSLTADAPEPELEYLLEEVLPLHPALQQVAREREAASEELKASRTAWLPDPVLFGSSRRELDGDVRSLGIGLQIPLWNQSRAAAERDRQLVRSQEQREEALRLELRAQVLVQHNHLRLSRRTLDLFQEGLLAQVDASMEIAEAGYREGEISFIEYLDARRTAQSIQIEYQQALYDWHVVRATLERAAGGGTL